MKVRAVQIDTELTMDKQNESEHIKESSESTVVASPMKNVKNDLATRNEATRNGDDHMSIAGNSNMDGTDGDMSKDEDMGPTDEIGSNEAIGAASESLVEEPQEKLTKLPIARIKNIIKLDPDVKKSSTEATFLITKSVELFVESLAWEAHRYTEQNRKKTMAKMDVEKAIDGVDALAFLDDAIED